MFVIGLLALWVLPSHVIAAEAPASTPTAMASTAKLPADYPEDFSRPHTMAQARPDYTDAFGEDEVVPDEPDADKAREDLMRPLDSPASVTSTPTKAP